MQSLETNSTLSNRNHHGQADSGSGQINEDSEGYMDIHGISEVCLRRGSRSAAVFTGNSLEFLRVNQGSDT